LLAIDEIFSAVPQHHRAPAVLSLGNDTLELRIVDGVIFNFHRQMFFTLLPGKPFRHRPGFQNSFHLQPEIVMQAAGIVLLNHKAGRAPDGFRAWLSASWLGSARE